MNRRVLKGAIALAIVMAVSVVALAIGGATSTPRVGTAFSTQPFTTQPFTTQPLATKLPAAKKPHGPIAPFTPSFFGMAMGADTIQASDTVFDSEMNSLRKLGVHWVRAGIPWALVQPHGPTDQQWTYIDRLAETIQAEGMQFVGIIDNPPKWASASVPPVAGCSTTPPFDEQAYATFAAAVAQRYTSSLISAIEIENSPNLPGVWPKPDPCGYAALMKQAYPAIKAVDPNIVVLNGGVGGVQSRQGSIAGATWIADLYSNGAKGTFDAVSFHPYSYPCAPSQGCAGRTWDDLPKVRATMVANGDSAKQIWASEFGAPTSGITGDGHVDEATQAAIMIDGMQQWVTFSWGGPFFVYEYRDYGTDPTDKSDWFGIVSNDLTHQKPAYAAYQYLATGVGSLPTVTSRR